MVILCPPTVSNLPDGMIVHPLAVHGDGRGDLIEVFRETWPTGLRPVQWNAVRSTSGVLRGVHVHPRHDDYLIVLGGRASVGVRDLRRGSPTEGWAGLLELSSAVPTAVTIPHGVAHGFYFEEPALHLYAVSAPWDPADELACHWADPALEIEWPCREPLLSDRDAGAPPLNVLVARLASRPAS